MNHNVQTFMSGCLTLKFSGSWKTVRISPSCAASFDELLVFSPALSTGEMGIVSSGTCWLGLGALATSAMVNAVGGMKEGY